MTKFQQILFDNSDKKYAEFQSKLIPTVNPKTVIGVRIPVVKKIAKKLFAENQDEVQKFLEKIPHKYYDENNLHVFLISQIKDFEQCIFQIENFLPQIDNWATCDSLKPNVFKKNKIKLLPYIKKWINSKQTYKMRFAILCLMSHYLREDFSTDYLKIVSKIKTNEYYVKMMQAWFFATALCFQYDATIPFIKNQALDDWTHNKAIQKAIESYRISPEIKVFLKSLKVAKNTT